MIFSVRPSCCVSLSTKRRPEQVPRHVARADRHPAEGGAARADAGHDRVHDESRGRLRDAAVDLLVLQGGRAADGVVRGQRVRVSET